MKVHLRLVNVRGYTYRVITLRPGTEAAFSTNYFHDTWHIVSDAHGARFLARLMWGLSYQRHPGTIILLHGEHIQPTPFGAEKSDPIALLPPALTRHDAKTLRLLHKQLKHLGPSQGTVRWQTFGLDQELEEWREDQNRDWSVERSDELWSWQEKQQLWKAEQMFRRGGFVCYAAPPEIMRRQAIIVSLMQTDQFGTDYHYLADNNRGHWADGEVQIFRDYHARRAAAAQARQEVLQQDNLPTEPWLLYQVIATRRDEILWRRRAALRRKRGQQEPKTSFQTV